MLKCKSWSCKVSVRRAGTPASGKPCPPQGHHFPNSKTKALLPSSRSEPPFESRTPLECDGSSEFFPQKKTHQVGCLSGGSRQPQAPAARRPSADGHLGPPSSRGGRRGCVRRGGRDASASSGARSAAEGTGTAPSATSQALGVLGCHPPTLMSPLTKERTSSAWLGTAPTRGAASWVMLAASLGLCRSGATHPPPPPQLGLPHPATSRSPGAPRGRTNIAPPVRRIALHPLQFFWLALPPTLLVSVVFFQKSCSSTELLTVNAAAGEKAWVPAQASHHPVGEIM